jgi:hypothetical protein
MPLMTAVVAAAFGWLGAGCGGSGGGNGGSAASLVGTWRAVSTGTPGNTVACPGEVVIGGTSNLQQISACGANDLTRFGADGTFESVSAGKDESGRFRIRGTWTLDGTTLTVTATEEASDENNNGIFDPNEVRVVSPPDPFNVRLTFDGPDRISALFTFFGSPDLKIYTRQ